MQLESAKVGQEETKERERCIDVILDLRRKRFPERFLHLGSSKTGWRPSTETAGLVSPAREAQGPALFQPCWMTTGKCFHSLVPLLHRGDYNVTFICSACLFRAETNACEPRHRAQHATAQVRWRNSVLSSKILAMEWWVFLRSEPNSARQVRVILFSPVPATKNWKLEHMQCSEVAPDTLQVTSCILFTEDFSGWKRF